MNLDDFSAMKKKKKKKKKKGFEDASETTEVCLDCVNIMCSVIIWGVFHFNVSKYLYGYFCRSRPRTMKKTMKKTVA